MPGTLTKVSFEDLSPTFANAITSSLLGYVPKITSLTYPGSNTAANPAGGETITINGANFQNNCVVWVANVAVSPLSFVNSSTLSFTTSAKAANTYQLYVINPDGAYAIALPGLVYSS